MYGSAVADPQQSSVSFSIPMDLTLPCRHYTAPMGFQLLWPKENIVFLPERTRKADDSSLGAENSTPLERQRVLGLVQKNPSLCVPRAARFIHFAATNQSVTFSFPLRRRGTTRISFFKRHPSVLEERVASASPSMAALKCSTLPLDCGNSLCAG